MMMIKSGELKNGSVMLLLADCMDYEHYFAVNMVQSCVCCVLNFPRPFAPSNDVVYHDEELKGLVNTKPLFSSEHTNSGNF